ncbi:MAG: HesA/MoeB/ThiF family protein [Proteobacteria bacterium]|nr:HesA/MoeB/ThiF family protein [Pseudomonadota bacterium]
MSLSNQQQQRYLRNTILPQIAESGQERLLKSKVLVIGAGGLGSPAIFYLAAAGVGNIGIIDNDVVELSNLQRQIIHSGNDIDRQKVISAKEKIEALNPDVSVKTHPIRANKENLTKLVKDYDLILDATDNFPTRFIINEICHNQKKPLIFAAVKGFLGQVSVFKSYLPNNPCYCCFNPNIVDESFSLPLSEKGILGSVAGTIGALQATTAIKELLEIGESLVGKILISDFLKSENRKVTLKKNPNCPICFDI